MGCSSSKAVQPPARKETILLQAGSGKIYGEGEEPPMEGEPEQAPPGEVSEAAAMGQAPEEGKEVREEPPKPAEEEPPKPAEEEPPKPAEEESPKPAEEEPPKPAEEEPPKPAEEEPPKPAEEEPPKPAEEEPPKPAEEEPPKPAEEEPPKPAEEEPPKPAEQPSVAPASPPPATPPASPPPGAELFDGVAWTKESPMGLYLKYSPKDGGTFLAAWSRGFEEEALAYARPSTFVNIPEHKFKKALSIQPRVNVGRVMTYQGWCQFVKEAKTVNADFVMLPKANEVEGLPKTTIFFHCGEKVVRHSAGCRPENLKFAEVVCAVSPKYEGFGGNKKLARDAFLTASRGASEKFHIVF